MDLEAKSAQETKNGKGCSKNPLKYNNLSLLLPRTKGKKQGKKKTKKERRNNIEEKKQENRDKGIHIYIYMLWSYYLVQVWPFEG